LDFILKASFQRFKVIKLIISQFIKYVNSFLQQILHKNTGGCFMQFYMKLLNNISYKDEAGQKMYFFGINNEYRE